MDAWVNGRKISFVSVDDRPHNEKSRILLWAGGKDKWCGALILPGTISIPVVEAAVERYLRETAEVILEEVSKAPGTLRLDTSDMPGGAIRFHAEPFLKKAESMISAGKNEEALNPQKAQEWGYIPEEGQE